MKTAIDRLIDANPCAFYVFDAAILKRRIAFLKAHLPEEAKICYAVKANPFIAKEILDEIPRFEICSPGEADICETLGIPADKMVISGVYKTPGRIEKMISSPSFDRIYTAESESQYELLCRLSRLYGKRIRVLLRLTNDSQFGMDEEKIGELIAGRGKEPFIHLCGIQFFSGTQKSSIKKYRREIEYLDSFLIRMKDEYQFEAEELEYGTGFPVSYFVSEESDEAELLDAFSGMILAMKCKPAITLEIGRSIAASCGRYFTRVVDIKQNKKQNYALVNGGMHHMVYFGQYMAMLQPRMSVIGKPDCNTGKSWTICGSLCSMNDLIAKQIPLPELEIGDTLCFENTGAYCMTEGISLFLSRDLPAVYLIRENGEVFCLRKSIETEEFNTPKYERIF